MAKHSLPQSSNRQAILLIAVASAVLAVAAIFGPIWIVRVGVIIAVIGTGLVLWFALRELTRQRRAHRIEVRNQTLRAAEAAERHHTETMEVIDRFSTRHHALTERFQITQRQLEQAKVELASVKGTLIATQLESRQRATRISELETEIAAHTAELAALAQAQQTAAEAALADVDDQVGELHQISEGVERDEATEADEAGESDVQQTPVQHIVAQRAESGQVASLPTESTGDVVNLPRYGAASKRAAQLPTARELWGEGNEPEPVNVSRVAFPVSHKRHA